MLRRVLSSVGAYPALPNLIRQRGSEGNVRLRDGAYLLRLAFESEFQGQEATYYEGPLRILYEDGPENETGDWLRGSGDLYLTSGSGPWVEPSEDQDQELPTFPRRSYQAYLRLNEIEISTDLRLSLEVTHFRSNPPEWKREGVLDAFFSDPEIVEGHLPKRLPGQLRQGSLSIGTIEMVWLAPWLRECSVRLDWEGNRSFPGKVDEEKDPWALLFKTVNWKMHFEPGRPFEMQPSLGSGEWTDDRLHQQMLHQRQGAPPDGRWRSHLLVVGQTDSDSYGVMFDNDGSDSCDFREGAAIAADYVPQESWNEGPSPRSHSEIEPLYFHTAAHEISHALGLAHGCPQKPTIMTKITCLPRLVGQGFPDATPADFSSRSQLLLRHLPDPLTRPGGHEGAPDSVWPGDIDTALDGLHLRIMSDLQRIPIGAPLRITLELTNEGDRVYPAPSSLRLKAGFVEGRIWGPTGEPRAFKTIVRLLSAGCIEPLHPGSSLLSDMTLVRGPHGALMPTPGHYRVDVALRWLDDTSWRFVLGSKGIEVTPPENEMHEQTAERLLRTPNVLLALALQLEDPKDGYQAIIQALNDETLRPHWSMTDIRLSQKHGRFTQAALTLDRTTVLSGHESAKVAESFLEAREFGWHISEHPEIAEILTRNLQTLKTPINPEDRAKVQALENAIMVQYAHQE